MNILAINDTKGTSDFTTRKKVVNAILNLKRSYKKACGYYHVSRTSAWRWIKARKKTNDDSSLVLRSHKPLSPHPKTCDKTVIDSIVNKHRRCPEKTPFEIWVELKGEFKTSFKYSFMTVLRTFQRHGWYKKYETNKKKKHDSLYYTPENTGENGKLISNLSLQSVTLYQ